MIDLNNTIMLNQSDHNNSMKKSGMSVQNSQISHTPDDLQIDPLLPSGFDVAVQHLPNPRNANSGTSSTDKLQEKMSQIKQISDIKEIRKITKHIESLQKSIINSKGNLTSEIKTSKVLNIPHFKEKTQAYGQSNGEAESEQRGSTSAVHASSHFKEKWQEYIKSKEVQAWSQRSDRPKILSKFNSVIESQNGIESKEVSLKRLHNDGQNDTMPASSHDAAPSSKHKQNMGTSVMSKGENSQKSLFKEMEYMVLLSQNLELLHLREQELLEEQKRKEEEAYLQQNLSSLNHELLQLWQKEELKPFEYKFEDQLKQTRMASIPSSNHKRKPTSSPRPIALHNRIRGKKPLLTNNKLRARLRSRGVVQGN